MGCTWRAAIAGSVSQVPLSIMNVTNVCRTLSDQLLSHCVESLISVILFVCLFLSSPAPRPGAPPRRAGAHPAPAHHPPAGRLSAHSWGSRPGRLEPGKGVCTHTHTHTTQHNTTRRVDFLRSSSSCFPCRRMGFGVCLLVVAFAPLGRAG